MTTELTTEKKKYLLLDTAGIRRQSQRELGAESFAVFRTVEAANDADVICIVVDGSQPLTNQDQIVASIAKDARRGIVILANKADIVDEDARVTFERSFYRKFDFLKIHKFIWISAKNEQNLDQVWQEIDAALAVTTQVIEQEQVRKLFNYLMKHKQPQKIRTQKRAVLYDLLYKGSNPHTFELLIKDRKALEATYTKFLENTIRRQFKLTGVGIKIKVTEVAKAKVLT